MRPSEDMISKFSRNVIIAGGVIFFVFSFLLEANEPPHVQTESANQPAPVVVFEPNFSGIHELKEWNAFDPRFAKLTRGWQGSPAVSIEINDPKETQVLTFPLDASVLSGARLKIEAMVRADNVTAPEKPYFGIKLGIQSEAEAEYADEKPKERYYSEQDQPAGTYDWRHVEYVVSLPRKITKAEFRIGLQLTTGKVSFSNIKITKIGAIWSRPRPLIPASGSISRFHQAPRLRGVMVSPESLTEADLRTLADEWKVNLIRWPLKVAQSAEFGTDTSEVAPSEYQKHLDECLQRLDAMLPLCKKYGILVAIDLHDLPGGYDNKTDTSAMFHSKIWQDEFSKVWEKIAVRYKGNEALWAYDLANEPNEKDVSPGLMGWNELAAYTAKIVRAIDPERPLIIEASNWSQPRAFDKLLPVPVSGVIYSVHLYNPVQLTHQGVSVVGHQYPLSGSYPGNFVGLDWNKERLRQMLKPVIEFQKDYNVPIFVGEFSCIRWAPGDSAYNYIKDCIDIFEENGWDWTYHAFREWNGWSVEHTGDRDNQEVSPTPTRRKELLLEWFSKNVREPLPQP